MPPSIGSVIDPDMTVPDRSGRPMPIVNGGKPIRDILA